MKTFIPTPQAFFMPAQTMFHKEGQELRQFVYFDRSNETDLNIDLPLGKALKGSVVYFIDPSDPTGNTIHQQVSIYRHQGKKYSTSIYESKYSHVKVSQNRVTVTMSFPLTDDINRLTARMQNFANIIIEESDEIAALLGAEGADKIQEAWQELAEQNNL